MTENSISLNEPGRFVVGCNYWASHAGTQMWSDWRPDVVEADFKQLSQAGLQVLRVFPLWPVFQPIHSLLGGAGAPVEIRMGEQPLAGDEAGRAGVSPEAMAHFEHMADLAQKYNLKLVVGLLTGWMSGRLFVPPALEGRNVLTDPLAIQWEVRFVRYFVRRLRHHPAILAWDLGNECNCMAAVPNHEAAWVWSATISNAIRVEDSTRPVVSGMHSLDEPDENGPWRIPDQGELMDVLTTHPYPYFTPHCDQEPVNTIRNGLHATAQTRWYADIGGKPGLAEEVGTLGPMIASEKIAADYLRMILYSLWANDCHGLLWWCAYDQDRLEHAPYDWTGIERELGLFRSDRSAKPVLDVLGGFGHFVQGLPLDKLPARRTEAVCILTHGQEQWAVAYASFILAKQAGFDLAFQSADRPLKDADLYMLPSLCGATGFSRRFWLALEKKVKAGATLYLSNQDAMLSPFEAPFGLEVQTRQRRTGPFNLRLAGLPDFSITLDVPFRQDLLPTRAEVLGREEDGNPAFTRSKLGKGWVYYLSVPLERSLSSIPGAFSGAQAQPFWRIYQQVAGSILAKRVVQKDHPLVGVTEHPLSEQECIAVLVNYSPSPQDLLVNLAQGWVVAETWHGQPPVLHGSAWHSTIAKNDALVLKLTRN